MVHRLPDRLAAILFVVVVLLVATGTATLAEGLVLAVSPLLVTLLMMFVITREGWTRPGWTRIGVTKLGLRWWPAALLATAGVSVLAVIAVHAFGLATWQTPTDEGIRDGATLLITAPVLAFAEEIGWRGYLHTRLIGLGERARALVIGAVWTAWHLPYILLTPYYHADGDRAVVLILFTGSVLAFALLFGRLRSRSTSLWPAVLAHAAHNATFAWLATYLLHTDTPVLVNEYLTGDTGLLVLLGTLAAAAAITAHRSPNERADTERIPITTP